MQIDEGVRCVPACTARTQQQPPLCDLWTPDANTRRAHKKTARVAAGVSRGGFSLSLTRARGASLREIKESERSRDKEG